MNEKKAKKIAQFSRIQLQIMVAYREIRTNSWHRLTHNHIIFISYWIDCYVSLLQHSITLSIWSQKEYK